MSNASMEMPRYKCHKEVWALKIAAVELDSDKAAKENCETDGSAMLVPEDTRYAPLRVDSAWLRRNPKVEAGGYFVQYQRQPGETEFYTAYSPAAAFEDGYTLV